MTWQSDLEALIEETKAQVKAMGGSTYVQPVVAQVPAVAETGKPATAQTPKPAIVEQPRAQPLEPITWPSVGSDQEEAKQRVASFKALQARMQREREDYFAKTLSNACNNTRAKPSSQC